MHATTVLTTLLKYINKIKMLIKQYQHVLQHQNLTSLDRLNFKMLELVFSFIHKSANCFPKRNEHVICTLFKFDQEK